MTVPPVPPVPHASPDDDVVLALRAAGCVFAEEEAALLREAAAFPAHLARLVDRRAGGEPLEHLLGWAAFAGLRVAVGPGVFVPRRRTELLVREAVRLLRDRTPLPSGPPPAGPAGPAGLARSEGHAGPAGRRGPAGPSAVVVDLCCGSGAVGLAVATQAGPVELVAADVDPTAVRWAGRNVGAGGRPGRPR